MTRGSGALAALLVVALSGVLSGCVVHTSSCRDFIVLDTAADRARAAQLVVDAEVRTTDRTADVDGEYRLHEATVTDVVKGSAPSGTLDVLAPSDRCTTDGQTVTYTDGDPLAEPGRYRLYLHRERPGLWRLIVPGAADRIGDD